MLCLSGRFVEGTICYGSLYGSLIDCVPKEGDGCFLLLRRIQFVDLMQMLGLFRRPENPVGGTRSSMSHGEAVDG